MFNLAPRFSVRDSLRRLPRFHEDFEGIFGWFGCQGDGGGGLLQWKAVADERAHVETAGENEPGNFGLQREVGRVAADEVFFVEADGGKVEGEGSRIL